MAAMETGINDFVETEQNIPKNENYIAFQITLPWQNERLFKYPWLQDRYGRDVHICLKS